MSPAAPRARRVPARMKIGELEEAAGVSRDTVHFYVRSGLLPRPRKTGATVAWYEPEHVDRLRRIRALRAHGLPLALIRRLLDAGATALGDRELELVGTLLACAERGSLTAPAGEHAASPDAGALATEVSLGLGASAAEDARLRTAIAAMAGLTGTSRALALAAAAAVTTELRVAASRGIEVLRAHVDGSGGDPAAVAAALAGAYAPLRGFAAAAAEVLWREALEAFALALVPALGAPARRTRARRG